MATKQTETNSDGDKIRALAAGTFATIKSRLPQGGALQARRLTNKSVQFYWRYSHEGKTHREPIGAYDPKAPPKKLDPGERGYSVAAALKKCDDLGTKHRERLNTGGYLEAKADEAREHQGKKEKQVEMSKRTLKALLAAYVAHLKAQRRRSSSEAATVFRLHVEEPWPSKAATPAAEITVDDVLDMMRRAVEAGKGRTANKLRSYLRAAFQCAVDVRTSAAIPVVFKSFDIQMNPAALTRRDARADRSDKNPLSADQLRTYWGLIKDRNDVQGAALRMHLLTGGQRIDQLLRLQVAKVGDDTITIFDVKGRPGGGPRAHTVPLVKEAAQALKLLSSKGEFVFSTTGGKRPINSATLGNWAREIAREHIDDFQLKRIRSGVETLLAAKGISREIRGHLQSHGLTGVQARHYDAHDYLPEKINALKILLTELLRRPKPAS